MTNAVKFTADGGSCQAAAHDWSAPRFTSQCSDTGIGVPAGDRERIFESFQQGGRGASREEGTGLGLTLSRRIVELLGGRMWLDSELGVGSTFGFSLPLDRRSREALHADGGSAASGRSWSSRTTGRPGSAEAYLSEST